MFAVANDFADRGIRQTAREMHHKVFEARKRILGDLHPDTLSSMYHLGLCYETEGNHKMAKELYGNVSKAQKRVLGETHSDTLRSIKALTTILEKDSSTITSRI